MKTRRAGWALSVVLGLTGPAWLAACSADTMDINSPETTSTANREKIDPALLMLIQRSRSSAQPGPSVGVVIRTRGEIDAARRAALEGRGARIGSVTGDVLTAEVPVRAVSGIAGLEFVMRVELSKQHRLR